MAMVVVRGAQRGLSLPAAVYKPLDSAQKKKETTTTKCRSVGCKEMRSTSFGHEPRCSLARVGGCFAPIYYGWRSGRTRVITSKTVPVDQ